MLAASINSRKKLHARTLHPKQQQILAKGTEAALCNSRRAASLLQDSKKLCVIFSAAEIA